MSIISGLNYAPISLFLKKFKNLNFLRQVSYFNRLKIPLNLNEIQTFLYHSIALEMLYILCF